MDTKTKEPGAVPPITRVNYWRVTSDRYTEHETFAPFNTHRHRHKTPNHCTNPLVDGLHQSTTCTYKYGTSDGCVSDLLQERGASAGPETGIGTIWCPHAACCPASHEQRMGMQKARASLPSSHRTSRPRPRRFPNLLPQKPQLWGRIENRRNGITTLLAHFSRNAKTYSDRRAKIGEWEPSLGAFALLPPSPLSLHIGFPSSLLVSLSSSAVFATPDQRRRRCAGTSAGERKLRASTRVSTSSPSARLFILVHHSL